MQKVNYGRYLGHLIHLIDTKVIATCDVCGRRLAPEAIRIGIHEGKVRVVCAGCANAEHLVPLATIEDPAQKRALLKERLEQAKR